MGLSDIRLMGRSFVEFNKLYSGYLLSPYVDSATSHFVGTSNKRYHKKLAHATTYEFDFETKEIIAHTERKVDVKYENKPSVVVYNMHYTLDKYALTSTGAFKDEVEFSLAYTRLDEIEFRRALNLLGHKLDGIARVMKASKLSVYREGKLTVVTGKTGRKKFVLAFNHIGTLSLSNSKVGKDTGKDLGNLIKEGVF